MKRFLMTAALAALVAVPASAQLQYFGYVGGADDDYALAQTKGFTNFAHLSAGENLTDPYMKNRVTAMAPLGIKAVIDLGKVLWCDYDLTGRYLWICSDWYQRWSAWKAFNASILTPDKVLAFSIRDEPFNWDVDMYSFEQAAATVKSDLPWIKLYMTEAACVVAWDNCGIFPGSGAFGRYSGSLPNIDWIGVAAYGVQPQSDPTFQTARDSFRARFPGKQWLYVLDGFWDHTLHGGTVDGMQYLARDWYDVARADANAVLLGVFIWYPIPGALGSQNFPCYVLSEHVRIGRAITGKSRAQTALPIGQLESVPNGTGLATGWACDPDGTLCENPPIDLYSNGIYYGPASYTSEYLFKPQCGTGTAYRFQQKLSNGTSGNPTTARARDLDSGGIVTLPNSCAGNPSCTWYTTLYDPKGYMEALSPTGTAAGWVCDPDAPQVSSKVRLALDDGTQLGTFTTNLASEQAVANECLGGYLHRFSVQLPSWTGCHRVYAYAQDLASAGNEKQIPWLCPDGWYCAMCR